MLWSGGIIPILAQAMERPWPDPRSTLSTSTNTLVMVDSLELHSSYILSANQTDHWGVYILPAINTVPRLNCVGKMRLVVPGPWSRSYWPLKTFACWHQLAQFHPLLCILDCILARGQVKTCMGLLLLERETCHDERLVNQSLSALKAMKGSQKQIRRLLSQLRLACVLPETMHQSIPIRTVFFPSSLRTKVSNLL